MSSALSDPLAQPTTVDAFLDWAVGNPGRHELVDGHLRAMAPERAGHARAKIRAYNAFERAVARGALPCEVLPDGMTVRVGVASAYEPDASVYCGPRMAEGDIEIPAPMIVVEVLSPSTGFYDRHNKLAGYLAVPSIHHYVIVDIDRRMVIHHARDGDRISTGIFSSGPLRFDPPGLDLTVEDLLGAT